MRRLLAFGLSTVAWIGAAQAQVVGWPEAIDALAQEKSKAQACVDLLKSVAGKSTLAEVQPLYIAAKARSDGIIAGLSTVVAERGKPEDLPGLQDGLDSSGAGLQKVCDAAAKAAREATGKKGPIDKLVTAAIGPMIDALKAAIGGIWNHWVENQKIEQKMILDQLRDAKWPDL